MAIKRMKTLKLPGLSDTYSFLQADATLAVQGEAADAKKVGDEFALVRTDVASRVRSLEEDAGTADLDITDAYGNVLARFEDGKFRTKAFRGYDYITYASPTGTYSGSALTLTCAQTFKKGDRVIIHCERGAMPWNGGAVVTYYEGSTIIKDSWRGDCAYLEHTITTDDVQIKAVYGASATGMTNGDVQLQVSLLGDMPIKPTVVTVKPDGSGDYTTIRGALDAIGTQASEPLHPYRIEVYPGTYNVMSDYSDTEIAAAAYDQTSFVGPKLLDGMHMVGMGLPQEVIISGVLDTDTWGSSIRGVVSTLNFQGSCSIENLTISAENLRYCIHDDFHYPVGQRRTVVMKNCVFKASGSMSYTVPVTYGAGARDGGVMLYAENCDFGPVFSIHTSQTTNNNSRYYLRNCKGSQADFGDIVSSSDTTKQNQVVFDSCDFLQVHVDNWQVSAENYQPHVQVFGTLATSPMYQMLPSVLYDTSDVTHSIPLTLDVGTAVEMYIVTSDKQSLRWKKATAVSKVSGVIVFKDSKTTYIQHRGYVRTDRLGLESFSVGDLVGMDEDGAAEIVQTEADAYGKIVMVDASGFGYVLLKGV